MKSQQYLERDNTVSSFGLMPQMSNPALKVLSEVLIVYTKDAAEWSTYLQTVLISCKRFSKKSVLLYEVESHTPVAQQDLSIFQNSRCIVLLLSGELLDVLGSSEVLKSFQNVLQPPGKVVVLFCGVTETEMLSECFQDWHQWKQLDPEDEPTTYISVVRQAVSEDSGCDSVTDSEVEVEAEDEGEEEKEVHTKLVCSTETRQHEDPQPQPGRSVHGNCIVIQPNRIRCGAQTKMYIILKCKLDNQVKTQVEFSSKDCSSKRESAVLENEYTVSVKAPDMPCGPVSVTLYFGDLTVCSTSVTYYTDMEEIGNYLLSAVNPIQFLCQAFKITTNNIEALDKLLTESLKKNIPACGLQLFGINQLEEENMSAYQRNEELPTLLHFAAKYGLKKLTVLLLQCPGALQAYSVVNKYGEYPNNIAEKNGFKDLREFMDEYVETAEMLKTHIKDNITQGEDEQTYESMSNMSRDILTKYSLNPGCDEDIYECMVELNTDSMEDIYEDMEKQPESSRDIQDPFFAQESMLRKFLEGKSSTSFDSAEEGEQEEEDPYKLCIDEDVYDTVEPGAIHPPEIINRPPAPIPRPSVSQEPQEPYISKVFSAREEAKLENLYAVVEPMSGLVRPVRDRSSTTTYDPYGGMKTPGQRQLIALQEKVKVGIFTVEEAVQQFKEWQLNQKSRGESFKFQEENLRKLRDSITRRQKEKSKTGKPLDLQITAPIRQFQGPPMKLECAVYESNARVLAAPPPPSQPINRGNWQTGSTTSSASNRSSTRSNMSFSSGAEGDNEDNVDNYRSPSPLPHAAEKLPELPPPRVPPRTPARHPESTNMDRYAPCPTRHVPGPRRCSPLPPVPRRTR